MAASRLLIIYFLIPSSRSVEEVREIRRVILRQEGGLERSEVREEHPVPARHHYVLHLDVAVTNLM
jgi:hypothetical protein